MKKLVLVVAGGIAVAGGLYTIAGSRGGESSKVSGIEGVGAAQLDSEVGGAGGTAAPRARNRALTKPVAVPPAGPVERVGSKDTEESQADDLPSNQTQTNTARSAGAEPATVESAGASEDAPTGEAGQPITFEVPEGASHQEFASAYENYKPANVQMPFMRTLSGEYLGTTANDTDEYELRFEVDGVIEGSEYVGKSLLSIEQNGQLIARMAGDWDSEFFKVNDEGELVFTDIGGLEETGGKITKYHVIKMNFSNPVAPPFTLSYFDGTGIKNLGSGVLVKQ